MALVTHTVVLVVIVTQPGLVSGALATHYLLLSSLTLDLEFVLYVKYKFKL